MPRVEWEWRFNPQIIISGLNFLVLFLGVVGLWFKMQADVSAARETIGELKAATQELVKANALQGERLTKVETKLEVVLPSLQRIEERQIRPTSQPDDRRR